MYRKLLLISFACLLLNFTNSSFAQEDNKLVILHTTSGKITIEFFPSDAPNHVDNFIKLAESGFYDRTIFHRIIKDFMIQGGDPKTKPGAYTQVSEWGTGDPGYSIDAEFNTIKHNRGIVSMARSTDPNSAGSQFFIVHKNSNFLDGQYTVFGRIATQESYETLDKIASLETTNDIAYDWGKGEILETEVVNRSQISNLLSQGEPERMSTSIDPTKNQPYKNEKIGISFSAPLGWLLQEPQKTRPEIPDIVAVGPKIADINPVISITIYYTDGRSLEQRISEIRETLQPSIDSEQLQIVSEEKTTMNGNEAFITTAVGVFENEDTKTNVKFQEVLIRTSEKFYAITYTNGEENFDSNLENFKETLDSFEILSKSAPIPIENITENNPTQGGGCLIATATYGTELAPQIQQLRELRDNHLLQTQSGTNFITKFNQFYYSFSPTIADLERESPIFKEVVKLALTPLISSLSILNYVDMDSEAKVLGYGISLILLNIGMYFIFPAIIIYRIRK